MLVLSWYSLPCDMQLACWTWPEQVVSVLHKPVVDCVRVVYQLYQPLSQHWRRRKVFFISVGVYVLCSLVYASSTSGEARKVNPEKTMTMSYAVKVVMSIDLCYIVTLCILYLDKEEYRLRLWNFAVRICKSISSIVRVLARQRPFILMWWRETHLLSVIHTQQLQSDKYKHVNSCTVKWLNKIHTKNFDLLHLIIQQSTEGTAHLLKTSGLWFNIR